MSSAISLLRLGDNPVFGRYRHSQLRLRRALFWYLATIIITTFVVSLTYIIQTNIGFSEERAARDLWIPLLIIQGLIVLIKGTGRTSAGLIQDKIDQTLDYQRLTPVSPIRNILGYLFGLPLLEYVMFALTLPHLAFVVIKGNIPLSTVLSVYLAFFVCAVFYHMTAIAVGMVMKRWIWGYLLSIFSVAFLNLFLAPLGSQLGLKFLQYLSVFPVIGQKVAPLIVPEVPAGGFQGFGPPGPAPQFQPGPGPQNLPPPGEGPLMSFADPVPFFEWTLSPFVFTLLLQSGLIVTFAMMAVRRWDKATKHSLSKPYALGVLAVFVFLVIGNLWPAITGEYMPFPIFGNRNLDSLREVIAIGLPLVYSIAAWLLCVLLFAITVPTHHAYVRGLRRARKLGHRTARPWDDDSANIPFMALFVLTAVVGYWVIYAQMSAAGFMDFLGNTGLEPWRLPLALALVLLNTLLLLQVVEIRGTVLTALLLWLLPILVAIVAGASMQEVTRFHTVLASLSPLATVLMTGVLPIESLAPIDPAANFGAFVTGSTTGLIFVSVQIAVLAVRWRQLRKTLQ